MPNVFDVWRIDKDLARVVLFRVLPGQEIRVGRQIEARCAQNGINPRTFKIFRLLGSYDLAFIQDKCSLGDAELAKTGSIPGITASTEYVCYKWQKRQSARSTFAIRDLSSDLLGLSFIKINPVLTQTRGLEAELSLVEYIQKAEPTVRMVGTLGWSEIILLIPDSSLSGILRRIGERFPGLIVLDQAFGTETFAEKSLTIIGHALNVTDPRGKRKSPVSMQELHNGELEVHFSVSCTPEAMTKLRASAQKHLPLMDETGMRIRLGVRDLDFKLKLNKIETLNQLVGKLDRFRRENQDALIRTHTELQYGRGAKSVWPDIKRMAGRVPLHLPVSAKQAQRLIKLGPEGASVATGIYHFNNLIQNRLLLDAFSDMIRAILSLMDESLREKPPLNATARLRLAARLQYLQQAISQRYQGAYLGVEESPWGASFGIQPTGIGVQRTLKALELFASELLRRLGKRWGGFVLMGRHRSPTMEHSEDILLIPPGDALDARKHWAMAHEIMHILQILVPDQLSVQSICGNSAGTRFTESDDHGRLIVECMADIMEYRLSCIFGLDGYLAAVWDYLKGGLFALTAESQLSSYLIRGFAVYCEARCVSLQTPPVRRRLRALFDNYVSLIKSLDVDISPLERVDERGQDHLEITFQRFLHAIYPHLGTMRNRLKGLRFAKKIGRADLNKVSAPVKRLERGQILPITWLKRPDVIAWQMIAPGAAKAKLGDHSTVAWLLSLWHYYQIKRRGPDLTKVRAPA